MSRKAWAKGWAYLLVPLLAACTTPGVPPTEEPKPTLPDHCAVGCPTGGGPLTLARQAYTLNNNGSTKFANWVAYRITEDTSASGRPRNWRADPDIPVGETLEPVDYTGANRALAVDRGHQANLASMAAVPNWQELNYLSNITPQKAALNQGAWERLEARERALSKEPGIEAVYVVTGPLYERFIGTLPGSNKVHTIPSGYWKVIFIGRTPEEGAYASFVMDQSTPRKANFCDFQVTVEDIEKRSGLTLWSALPVMAQAALKSRQGQLPKRLGCQ
ncbi:Nuclease precursor [compost metagenome]